MGLFDRLNDKLTVAKETAKGLTSVAKDVVDRVKVSDIQNYAGKVFGGDFAEGSVFSIDGEEGTIYSNKEKVYTFSCETIQNGVQEQSSGGESLGIVTTATKTRYKLWFNDGKVAVVEPIPEKATLFNETFQVFDQSIELGDVSLNILSIVLNNIVQGMVGFTDSDCERIKKVIENIELANKYRNENNHYLRMSNSDFNTINWVIYNYRRINEMNKAVVGIDDKDVEKSIDSLLKELQVVYDLIKDNITTPKRTSERQSLSNYKYCAYEMQIDLDRDIALELMAKLTKDLLEKKVDKEEALILNSYLLNQFNSLANDELKGMVTISITQYERDLIYDCLGEQVDLFYRASEISEREYKIEDSEMFKEAAVQTYTIQQVFNPNY